MHVYIVYIQHVYCIYSRYILYIFYILYVFSALVPSESLAGVTKQSAIEGNLDAAHPQHGIYTAAKENHVQCLTASNPGTHTDR